MKRLRDFSRALFASFSSASRNSPAMQRRASALPAAFRSHPRASATKPGIYLYDSLTRHRPCEQAKPLRERIKRLRDFSRALFASFSSASRNSPAMRRRASALPAAHRFHSRESAMKLRTYLYNPLTRHRPGKTPQPPRDRLLSSRTSLPSPRVSDETRNLFLQSANAVSPGENSPITA